VLPTPLEISGNQTVKHIIPMA